MPEQMFPDVFPSDYDPSDPASIERYAKRLIGRTLREALRADRGLAPAPGKGSFGEDLERKYFKLLRSNESRPDFEQAGVELKSSCLRRVGKDGRLVSKERIALSMIDYGSVVDEEWETSAFLKKSRRILFVFYLYEKGVSPLDCVVKYVGLWTIPNECHPMLRDDWLSIQGVVKSVGPVGLSGGGTDHLEAMKKDAKGGTLRRAYAFKQSFVNKYILPRVQWSQPILPSEYDEGVIAVAASKLERAFEPYLGLTVEELAVRLSVSTCRLAKSYYADVTKAILGVDPDNALEDVTVRTIRLDHGKSKPKESVSFPAFRYLELVEEQWSTSTLRELLCRPFLFVVFRQGRPGGPRVLSGARLWLMPEDDREGEVRRVWEETVARIKHGRAHDLPKTAESPICHVRPHGRNSSDRLPTPLNGMQPRKCFWLRNSYVESVIG